MQLRHFLPVTLKVALMPRSVWRAWLPFGLWIAELSVQLFICVILSQSVPHFPLPVTYTSPLLYIAFHVFFRANLLVCPRDSF